MSTAAFASFLACRWAQASFWHVDRHILACRQPQLRRLLACPRAHIILACRRAHFACRRAHLLFYTFYYFSFPGYFFASRAVILTCRRAHFACRRAHLLFYTIFPFQATFLHREPSFWYVDGRILHVDGHIYYFTLYYFPFPGYFFASRAVILFCMSAGTFTILHIAIFPFQATFLHREPSF